MRIPVGARGRPRSLPSVLSPVPVLLLLLLLACGGQEEGGPANLAEDSAGIRIVESVAPGWGESEGWRVDPSPELEIGARGGPGEQQLFRVSDARLLSDGSVVIGNRGTFEVRLYDGEGGLVWTAGSEGDGPGDFRSIAMLDVLGEDSIGVFDSQLVRYSILGRDGRLGRIVSLPRAGGGTHFPVGRTDDGHLIAYLGWVGADAPGETSRYRPEDVFVRYSLEAASLDTVGAFAGFEQFIVAAEAGGLHGTPAFPWSRLQAVRGNTLLIAYTERFELHTHALTGEPRSITRRSLEPRPITERDRAEFREDGLEQLRDDPPPTQAMRDRIVRFYDLMSFPPTHPVLERMIVDSGGRVWLQHADDSPIGGEALWSVFDPGGEWLGEVGMDEALRPTEIGDDYVLGVAFDELNVESVRLHRIRKR